MASLCPTQQQLQDFALGALPSFVMDEVADHVAQCPNCDSLLEKLDHCEDPLVQELRQLCSGTDVYPPGEARGGAVPALSGTSSSDVNLDPGKRFARKLEEGPCRVGRFELEAELGSGSFGHVFKAHDVELDRIVALKIQRAGCFASNEEIERFLREARSAAQLHHPGIVTLYESGQTEDGICFLVTEYVEGETLEQRIQQGSSDSRTAAKLIADLARALQYAHEHGVVHRDVKPSNVMLDREEHPHVTDFGLAKRLAEDVSLTSDGRVMGTPAYVSPEQARGDSHHVDPRSDTYSLGVILYELLTGERPFQGNRRLLLLQVLEDEPRPLRQLKEQVPRDLETICLKAMAKSPARRYQTAQELAEDLERFLAHEPIRARPQGRMEKLWRWCRRYPLAVSVLMAVLLGSALGFGYLSHLSDRLVEESAVHSARLEAEMLQRIHNYYSEKIVDRVDGKKVRKSHDYAQRNDSIPIPATFMIDAGQYVSADQSGVEVRMFSRYRWRKDGGPHSSFDFRALDVLEDKLARGEADVSYYEIGERNGRRVVLYAKGQIMRKTCMECHNAPKGSSPRKDWKEGELAGALTVVHPLDHDVERARSGLGGVFVVVGSVIALLVGVSFMVMLRARFRDART